MLARLPHRNGALLRQLRRCCASYSSLEDGSRAFPWRAAPPREQKPILVEFLKAVAYKLVYVRTFESDYDAQVFWDNFLAEGVATAFRAITDSIFQHRTLQRSSEASTAATDAPDLSAVLEGNLATFYEQALSDVKSNGQNIVYELLELGKPTIATMELLVGVHRSDALARRKACERSGGFLNLDLFATLTPRKELSEQEGDEAWDAVQGSDKVVLRVWTDIRAKEKFYIVDDVTGERVQGSDEPQTNVHRLLFETSFYFDDWKNATEAEHEWQVVDIDNWLEGNPFYTLPKKVSKPQIESDEEARS